MKIYTSYFANAKALNKNGITPIGIAQWPPKWFSGTSLKHLAPPAYLLRGDYTREQYIEIYTREVLSRIDVSILMKQLGYFGNNRDVALCCYEKPGDFCHRHLLAEYLRSKGYDVVEFTDPNAEAPKPKPIVPTQPSLFDL